MITEVEGAEREQVIQWMEEGRDVLGIIIRLFHDFDQLNGPLRTAETECQRLQAMLSEFQRMSTLAESLNRECQQLRNEVSRLQADRARSQKEREEMAEWFGALMNEAVGRLRAGQPAA